MLSRDFAVEFTPRKAFVERRTVNFTVEPTYFAVSLEREKNFAIFIGLGCRYPL